MYQLSAVSYNGTNSTTKGFLIFSNLFSAGTTCPNETVCVFVSDCAR